MGTLLVPKAHCPCMAGYYNKGLVMVSHIHTLWSIYMCTCTSPNEWQMCVKSQSHQSAHSESLVSNDDAAPLVFCIRRHSIPRYNQIGTESRRQILCCHQLKCGEKFFANHNIYGMCMWYGEITNLLWVLLSYLWKQLFHAGHTHQKILCLVC